MNISWTRRGARGATLATVLTAATLFAGCASGPRLVRTEVTNYNEWATLPAERTYTFARTLEYQNSLEVKSYEDIVRDELAVQGFRLVTEPAEAKLLVTLRPSVVTTQVRVRDSWPYGGGFGPYGGLGYYGGFYGRGFGGYGGYGGYGPGWYDPFWSDFNSYSIDIAHRRLELDIDSRTVAGKRYYEGRVETTGGRSSSGEVAPYLVRALFVDFPGGNGQTRRVDVPVPRS